MAIPKYNEFFVPVLQALSQNTIRSVSEIRSDCVKRIRLTKEECNEYLPSGKQKVVDNRIGWAMSYLRKAHLITAISRGHCQITPDGLNALSSNSDISIAYLEQFASFRAFYGKESLPVKSGIK